MQRLNGFLYFLSAFIATGALLLFAALPLRLYHSVWEGYRILAVPASADIETYLAAAERVGVSGIVSELSVAARTSLLGANRYGTLPLTDMSRYGRWFSDTDGAFRYFYIPYTSLVQFVKLYLTLYREKVAFYLEPALPYAPFRALLAAILFFYCIIGSRKKTLFFAASVGFLCYALCVKSSLSLTTALLSILTAAYWLEALDNEVSIPWKQLKERIHRNIFMLILPAVPFVTAVIDGLLPFGFFLLALLLSASALFSMHSFLQLQELTRDQYRQHPSLKVFVMHPQSWSQFWNTRYAVTATVLSGGLLLISALLPLVLSPNRLTHTAGVLTVPQPVSRPPLPFTDAGFFTARSAQPAAALPDLTNYIEDCWYIAARPYLNVHDPLRPLVPHDTITFDSFREDAAGKLVREEKTLYTFDTDFIIHTLQQRQLAVLPLEKMLIAQNGFITAAHRTLRLSTLGTFTAFFISLGTLLFPCILIIIAKIR